ncbi:MAG: asparagine synthase (glutamine-hydrolyzing) [Planctomycetes bacterium]|nr:asparagine synthase (glutamine-hydrolyzing) [Planctomycetota bacterium]
MKFSNADRVDPARLRAMATAMFHRGPDADGFHELGRVGFAFRRLAIIDRVGSNQPIHNEDRSVSIVFNGEIYNFIELRAQLIAKGHRFTTAGDTETIVHGYEEWGARGICERLNGMFAFALHDQKRDVIVLGRDRMGIKPLHLLRTHDGVAFASEIKSLLVDPAFTRRVDPRAFVEYVALGYVPGPHTIYAGIEKVLPGHFATITNSAVTIERYFDVAFDTTTTDAERARVDVHALLHDAVTSQLVSEVPLGCFLSGGIDSSAVALGMVEARGRSIDAVTVGFDDARFDEREAAHVVARALGIEPHEEVVHPDPSVLDALAFNYDEPHADPSIVPTFLLCQAARRHVTVALSGDGGDEMFGGYRRYAFDVLENRVRSLLPRALRRGVIGPLGRAWPKADTLPRPLRFKATLVNLGLDAVDAYCRSVARVKPEDVEEFVDPDLLRATDGWRAVDRFRAIDERRKLDDPLLRARALDVDTWLPDDCLVKVDRASMAHSLEVRVPFLDGPLVDYAARLHPRLLMRGREGKVLLKRVLRGRLPDETLDRRKHGFDLPVRAWLAGPLARELDALCAPSSPLRGYFDLGTLSRYLAEERRGSRDRTRELWTALVFARFHAKWIGSGGGSA